jgi:hypothetical protein
MIVKSSNSFHTYFDSDFFAAQSVGIIHWPPFPGFWRDNRSVSYRFYPHFQPYVLDLIRRLNAGGIAGLEGADTEYQKNSDGSYVTLPDSTRATLTGAATAVNVDDGTSIALLAGAPLTLPDGTNVTIADQTAASLLDGTSVKISPAATVSMPAAIPATFPSGSQLTIGGTIYVLPEHTPVSLPAETEVALSDGTRARLPASTALGLRSGLPEPVLYAPIFSQTQYEPTNVVARPYPVRDLDFTTSGAYSIYNWELFFHIPLLIAIHLSKNQQFEDAQRWFQFIFDPSDSSSGPTPQRFWKVRPFQASDVELIEQILINLSTGADPQLQADTISSIADWKDNPFEPFTIGRFRPSAFMLKTVMAYLDNLIAWGDSLFAQYTIETINEATQLYVLAANILGPKPQAVPPKGTVAPRTYAQLRANLDAFGNSLQELEVDLPFDIGPTPSSVNNDGGAPTLGSIGEMLYFCVPQNDQLLAYWDTVADRLFKIHNSLNLQGVFQKLPLFDPPIDPALLVRATAAGVDVSAIVNGLNQPLPLVRFSLLIAKATELAQEVKSLGGALLAAMEKNDNEALALLRAQHENTQHGLQQSVKYAQWQEAIKAREGLQQSLTNAVNRYSYYQQQLGKQPNEISVPTLDDLDASAIESFSFQSNEPAVPLKAITVDISSDSASVSDGEVKTISRHEKEEIDKLELARDFQVTASALEGVGALLSLVPQFGAHLTPLGVGAAVGFGGVQLSKMMSGLGTVAKIVSEEMQYEAGKTAKIGSYERREQEWVNQSNLAAGEINLIFKQLRAAQIREALTSKEYRNHQAQMAHSQAIVDFLQDKDTNQGLYIWMKREVRGIYNAVFQLAFEVARKSEIALQREIGDDSQTFIQANYLDGAQGLLAGERLLADVKRMEITFHDLNRREYEMTKHVSILQVAPLALLQLRATGSCTVSLPEELFDLDGPGHYFRRMKTVAVTIPCVAGPYVGVNCTLTLLNSSIRTSAQVGASGYPRTGSDDPRFDDNYSAVQTIVTSAGVNDSGLFETNLRDERYLPFESSGVISTWQISLPADVPQFDRNSISDVILHVRYTARDGGDVLKKPAVANLTQLIDAAQTVGSRRLLSVRHDFPTDWAKFRGVTLAAGTPTASLSLTLLPQHYPFWAQGIVGTKPLIDVAIFAEPRPGDTATSINLYDHADKSGQSDALSKNPTFGNLFAGSLKNIARPAAITDSSHPPLSLFFDDNNLSDVWVVLTWGKS